MKTSDQFINESKDNNQDTRKTNWLFNGSLALLVLSLVILLFYHFANRKIITELENEQSQFLLTQTNNLSVIDNYIGSFNEIESILDSIKQKEGYITLLNTDNADNNLSMDSKNRIIENIKILNYYLDQNKKQIAKINRKLVNSGMQSTQLQKKLDKLTLQINESDNSIADLKLQLVNRNIEVSQLNQKIDTMDLKIKIQGIIIKNEQIQFNRAYYIVGSYKELKSKNIIVQSDGFLGLGRSTSVNTKVSNESFNNIDLWEITSIAVGTQNAKLITNHPEESYKWVKNGNNIASLEILEPYSFWKYTRYAVLEAN